MINIIVLFEPIMVRIGNCCYLSVCVLIDNHHQISSKKANSMKEMCFIFCLVLIMNNLIAQSHKSICPDLSELNSDSISKNSDDEIVFTPAGPALKSNVHLVDSEHHLNIKDGRIQIIHTKTGKVIQEFDNVTTRNNNEVNRNIFSGLNNKNVPYESGYITDSYWNNTSNMPITYFSTNCIVPNPPVTNSNQLIYLFNGLVSFKSNAILQPVLQWGYSPAGGGNYWSITNWYVWGSANYQYFHGSLVEVNPGTNLLGVMELLSQSNDTSFNYISSFKGFPNTQLQVRNVRELNWAYEALEVYYIYKCTDYPVENKIRMTNIEIKLNSIHPSLLWNYQDIVTEYGQHTDIVSNSSYNGMVEIYFHNTCAPTSIANIDYADEIHIFPNPIENLLHINTNKPFNNCRIEIYNSLGTLIQTVVNKNIDIGFNIDMQNYSAGLYLIKFYYDNKIYTSKIIKK